jgi:histidyl-tRNA synthetase
VLALEEAGVSAEEPRIDVYFMFGDGVERSRALAEMAKLRAAGVACEAEYAGRSLKGQRTHLARLGASGYALVTVDGATVRRARDDAEREVPVGEIAEAFLE